MSKLCTTFQIFNFLDFKDFMARFQEFRAKQIHGN